LIISPSARWNSFVRLTRIAAVASILLVPVPGFAQGWIEYVNEVDRFGVTLPGQPSSQEITTTSSQGVTLPARVYSVDNGPSRYSITVVDYSSNDDIADVIGAVAHEAWQIRKRDGEITFDAYAQADRIAGHELYLTNPDRSLTLVGIFLHEKRLYILEATVPPDAPPPLLFQQSLHVFDETGERVRYEINADGQRLRRVPTGCF
jgi:hypothetical protein